MAWEPLYHRREYYASNFCLIPLAVVLLIAIARVPCVGAQQRGSSPPITAIREYRRQHAREILGELAKLLEIPNLASDSVNMDRNAAMLQRVLEARGASTRLVRPRGGPPAILGELRVPNAARTLLIYAHYDGQPVELSSWTTPPWRPTLLDDARERGGREIPIEGAGEIPRDARLYARSASDDKSPIVAMLTAIDALRASAIPITVNLRFFFEGEEEAGSSHLAEILQLADTSLRADLMIVCDGPVHFTGRPQIVFGARGIQELELTVYGAARALHSGHYGNWAPNPAVLLAELIAGLRTGDGRIALPGFLDQVRPVTSVERAAIRGIPNRDAELRSALWLGATEARNARLDDRVMLPALNVSGLRSGGTANAIPTTATASVDFRLVPDQTPDHVRRSVETYLHQRGFLVIAEEPDSATRVRHPRIARVVWGPGYPATRTPLESRAVLPLVRAVWGATAGRALLVPTMGASLPLHLFREHSTTPIVALPIVNYDNRQHAADENVRLQNVWDGMELFAAVVSSYGARGLGGGDQSTRTMRSRH